MAVCLGPELSKLAALWTVYAFNELTITLLYTDWTKEYCTLLIQNTSVKRRHVGEDGWQDGFMGDQSTWLLKG